MKTKVALFKCCADHIELIPNGDKKILSRLTCTGYCEDKWICNKLANEYRKCKEIENGAKEHVRGL